MTFDERLEHDTAVSTSLFLIESVSTTLFPLVFCTQSFSLDGAHLKGAFNGSILTITTTDANNK